MKMSERYIFFLQLTDELPSLYFHLGQILKAWGVMLIPLRLKDFKVIQDSRLSEMVVYLPDIASYRQYLKVQEEYLNICFNLKQVRLFEISSFRKNEKLHRLEKAKLYFHFSMPLPLEEVSLKILEEVQDRSQVVEKWPGGRRSKLPMV
jgi:hypothetical protein